MMYCYVSQPNSVVIEVEVDQKANGQECLDKVCSQLGIVEEDYFGLQFQGAKGEALWLNNRNRIDRQLSGHSSVPYRFQLRVKFYVPPHLLLQDTSKHLFYLQVTKEIQTQKLVVQDEDQLVQIVALMAQAECGDQNNNCMLLEYYHKILQGIQVSTKELVCKVAEKHHELMGTSKQSAEYKLLQEASTLQNYGMEFHMAKHASGEVVKIGVGPEGVFLYDNSGKQQQKIEYAILERAVHNSRKCFIYTFNEAGEVSEPPVELRMVSSNAANALYRCITEMHSFFRCDTVNDEVSSQVSRDLKGILASLFNENTTLGQNYVFDVRQTCREVYDSTRRKLLRQSSHQYDNQESPPDGTDPMDCADGLDKDQEVQILKEKLEKMQDSFVCRVCMDQAISTAMSPCWHLVCCQDCALRLTECPLCRTTINNVQKVFIPTTLKM